MSSKGVLKSNGARLKSSKNGTSVHRKDRKQDDFRLFLKLLQLWRSCIFFMTPVFAARTLPQKHRQGLRRSKETVWNLLQALDESGTASQSSPAQSMTEVVHDPLLHLQIAVGLNICWDVRACVTALLYVEEAEVFLSFPCSWQIARMHVFTSVWYQSSLCQMIFSWIMLELHATLNVSEIIHF